jgi:hypothetical protein
VAYAGGLENRYTSSAMNLVHVRKFFNAFTVFDYGGVFVWSEEDRRGRVGTFMWSQFGHREKTGGPPCALTGKSCLVSPGAYLVSSSTMIRRAGIILLTIAFSLGAGQGGPRAASWVLCVGSQGHIAVEVVDNCCVPGNTDGRAAEQSDQVSQDCGSCTDYPLTLATSRTAPRGSSPGVDPPAFVPVGFAYLHSPPGYLSPTAGPAPLDTPPKLASPAPLRC